MKLTRTCCIGIVAVFLVTRIGNSVKGSQVPLMKPFDCDDWIEAVSFYDWYFEPPNPETVEVCLRSGVDPNIKDHYG